MRYKIKYLLIVLICLITLVIINTSISFSFDNVATTDSYSFELACPEKANVGQEISCNLNVIGSTIGAFEANISIEGLELIEFTKNEMWDYAELSEYNNIISVFNKTDYENSVGIGTLLLKVLDDNIDKNIKVENIKVFNDSESISLSNISNNIRMLSSDNNLQNLSIDGVQLYPSFDSLTTEYYATVDMEKININATPAEYGSVTGIGIKDLEYGENKFEVISISETGTEKSYNITINRLDNRSEDCYLQSITTDGAIVEFNKDKLVYNILLPIDISKFSVTGIPNDDKSTLSYPSGQSVELENGETKQLSIIVKSEKGNEKQYIFNITRERIKSDNNYLKSVNISSGNVDFTKDNSIYYITIPGDTSKFAISGELEDNNATISYPNGQSVQLEYGETKQLTILVKSEKGSERQYIFYINKEDNRSNNTYLKSVNISNGNIDFNKESLTYNIQISSDISTFEIDGEVEDEKSTISYINGKSIELNYGETKQLILRVISESGSERNYVFNITREDIRNNNTYLKSLFVSNYNINFDKNQYSYKLDVENDVSSVTIYGVVEDANSIVSGLGKKNLKEGNNIFEIVVTSEDNTKKSYVITIYRAKKLQQQNLSNNNEIDKVIVNGVEIQNIDNIFTFNVKNQIDIADIECTLKDDKAKVIVDGNTNLSLGENNFSITVISESGEAKKYKLIVNREEKLFNLSNNIEDISNIIKYSTQNHINVYVENDNMIIYKEVLEKLKDTNKIITYNILNNNKIEYSVTINSKDILKSKDINILMDKTLIYNDDKKESLNVNFENNNTISKYIIRLNVADLNNTTNNVNVYKYKNSKLILLHKNIKINDKYIEFETDELTNYLISNEKNNISSNFIYAIYIIELIIIVLLVMFLRKISIKEKHSASYKY